MADLSGSVAIVTGASRYLGIGRAAALRLAHAGASVAVCGRARGAASTLSAKEESIGWAGAVSVAAEIEALGGRGFAMDCDVTSADDVPRFVAEVMEKWGRIDIIVNNAGAPGGTDTRAIIDTEDDAWDRAIRANLTGAYMMTKHGAPHIIAGGVGGAIVNVSSLAGRKGYRNFGGYCAAKFGVIGLTQQSALELAPHLIRVNCVCPGAIDTNMLGDVVEKSAARRGVPETQVRAHVAGPVPLGRIGTPEDIAGAVMFFVGSDAAYVTGQTLNVDGGVRMD